MFKLYLIDVSGFIFRAFYALPPLSRKDGVPVGAVYGFCSMMLKLHEKIAASHSQDKGQDKGQAEEQIGWVCVFDAARHNFRHDIDPEYKANRGETPPELAPQFDLIRKAVQAFHCPMLEKNGYEADDVIATCCRLCEQNGIESVVVSSDKDLMQLIRSGVTLYDPMKEKWIQNDDVLAKFGVPPYQVTDVQALAGDASDGIRGVPGIGVKTAAELIRQYGSLDNLLDSISSIQKPKRRELLQQYSQNARIAKQLVTLCDHADLGFDGEDSFKDLLSMSQESVRVWNQQTRQDVQIFFQEQEFSGLQKKVQSVNTHTHVAYSPDTKGNSSNSSSSLDRSNREIPKFSSISFVKSLSDLKAADLLAKAQGQNLFVHIVFPKKKTEGDQGAVLCSIGGTSEHLYVFSLSNLLPEDKLTSFLSPILRNNRVVSYDLKQLFHFCQEEFPQGDDLQLMSYLLYGIGTFQTLKNQLGVFPSNLEQGPSGASEKGSLDCPDYVQGAIDDIALFPESLGFLKEQLQKHSALQKLYDQIDRPVLCSVFEMEQQGIKLNSECLQKFGEELDHDMDEVQTLIFQCAGEPFNLASGRQLGKILFEKLQIPHLGKTKNGDYKTDSTTLTNLLKKQDFPIISLILKWRGIFKLRTTYTQSLIQDIDPKDGRIHSTFLMTQTNTGRLASRQPNLQNIPVRTSEGARIRSAFSGEGQNYLASFDYSQIELRLLASIGRVTSLQRAFESGQDIHLTTAAQVFHVSPEEVTHEMRSRAKAINFGIIYGQGSFGLSEQLHIPVSEAKEIIQKYFQVYPEIEDYIENCKQFAQQYGYVETLFGRRCFTPDINNRNAILRQAAQRQAVNAVLQGSNADIIRKAMVLIRSLSLPIKMILQIHDELIFEGALEDLQAAAPKIVSVMTQDVFGETQKQRQPIPLEVHYSFAKTWGEL